MSFMDVLDFIDTYIWYVAFVLIICVGVYATVRLRGIQVAGFKEMVKVTFLNRGDRREGKLSSFQVFCMSMGSRIGVGNITGPILAILVGGPGAILWMWVFALIGMATSFLETTVAQIYKVPKENGGYRGGPAYTLFHGLGMKRLGMIAAFVMILMYLVGFISGEVISMSEAVHNAFDFDGINLVFAVLLTAATALLLVGGVYKIADLSVKVVPLMAIAWFAVCIVSIAFGPEGVLNGIYSIFEYAFNIPSVIGGGVGAIIITGMQRGVWSNEAGIGTITNLSGMADVKHPVSQGYTQAIGVLIDTLVSTMTALVVLSYADINALVGSGLESIPLLQSIFTDTLGSVAPYVVMIFMFGHDLHVHLRVHLPDVGHRHRGGQPDADQGEQGRQVGHVGPSARRRVPFQLLRVRCARRHHGHTARGVRVLQHVHHDQAGTARYRGVQGLQETEGGGR